MATTASPSAHSAGTSGSRCRVQRPVAWRPMEVIEALERVAYLHDRKLDPSQKAAAFLKAADVVRGLPDGELERRHADGKLEELPGIGKSTAAVISQALDGKVPDRITELEASSVIPLGEGAEIRAAL